nr:hypothetical protein CFP56_37117 [Quercus suber]
MSKKSDPKQTKVFPLGGDAKTVFTSPWWSARAQDRSYRNERASERFTDQTTLTIRRRRRICAVREDRFEDEGFSRHVAMSEEQQKEFSNDVLSGLTSRH